MAARSNRTLHIIGFAVMVLLTMLFLGSRKGSNDAIRAIPVQLERGSYGIAMLDTAEKRFWVYEISSRGPADSRLRLLAARDWQYDRFLRQYNTAEPSPLQVRNIIERAGPNDLQDVNSPGGKHR